MDSGFSWCGRSTLTKSDQSSEPAPWASLCLLEMEQAADRPLGLSALLVLTGPPRLARDSEACPGRGRGGVLLGADVERSHQPHKSRALFCLKPPKVPVASPGRPRPQPALSAAWCGPQPLQPSPAAPPPPHPTARNSVKATADPGLSQSQMLHRGLWVNYLL